MKGDDNLKPFQQALYGLIRQKGFPVNGSQKYSRVLRIDEEYKEEFIELYKLVLNTVEEIGLRAGRPAADAKDQELKLMMIHPLWMAQQLPSLQ